MTADIGEVAPDFSLPSANNETISLAQFRGQKHVILSFHVFNFTSGWTTQAAAFRQYNNRLQELGAQVLGISCDHVASHRAWATALGGLPYPELSDWEPKGQTSRAYGLWNPERGASQRAVLIIDKEGIVRYRRTYSAPNLPDLEEIVRELQRLEAPGTQVRSA
jgi:mycoredoxin-dependent peroxiredoxin